MPTSPPRPRKVAIITGAARRVGRAIALHLAQHGYDLLITYNKSSDSDITTLAHFAAQFGAHLTAVKVDLTSDDAVHNILKAHNASPLSGRLDLLVHNASIFPKADLAQTTSSLIRELFKLHFETPLLLTQALADLLRAGRGSVVTMTDLAADCPFKHHLAYSASKAALQNLTLGLAKTLAPEARANAIAPGAVAFPDDMPQEAQQAYLQKVPLARPGTPEEVAQTVLWLADQATYTTGQVIRLDGGRSLN